MKAVDMFANVGGMALYQNFEVVGYFERRKQCKDILVARMNQGFLDSAPIYESVNLLPKADILLSKFSTANKFQLTMDALDVTNAKYIFFQSPALITKKTEQWRTILKGIAEKGFDVTWTILSPSNIGSPHIRRILFCFGIRVREPYKITSNFLAWENKTMFMDGFFKGKEYTNLKSNGYIDHKLSSPIQKEDGTNSWMWITPKAVHLSRQKTLSLQKQVYEDVNTAEKEEYLTLDFIEWLMGFPCGWCDKERETLISFMTWNNEPNIQRMTNTLKKKETAAICNATIPQLAAHAISILSERFQ